MDAVTAFAPYELVPGDEASGLLVIADHAMNLLPPAYGTLGLAAGEIERHIGYDIGVAEMTRAFARHAGAPALLARFSRLLIDANRGEDDPTLVMRLSDGAIVPGNARVDAVERARRIALYHRPYHDAIAATLDRLLAAGRPPVIVSLHSFTPVWSGAPRPWQVGVLWDNDPRLPLPLIARLRAVGWQVGDNEPYDGALANDTLFRHGTARGFAHVLIEVRQDLIAEPAAAAAWGERLWAALADLVDRPEVRAVGQFGSRTGPIG